MTEYFGVCLIVATITLAVYALMNFGTFALLKAIEWYKRTRSDRNVKAINELVDKLATEAKEVVKEIKDDKKSKKNTVEFKTKKEESEPVDVDLDDLLPF